MKAKRRWRPRPLVIFFVVALMLAFGALAVYAALPVPTFDLVPSGAFSPAVWSPSSNKWETGNPGGYSEGSTAAMSIHFKADSLVTDTNYQVFICLQIEDGANTPFNYAFTDFNPWDSTVLPPSLPAANQAALITPVPLYTDPAWDQDDPNIWGYNLDIVTVAGPERGTAAPDCDDNYFGYLVTFLVPAGNADSWIVYGGRIAKAGDLIPPPSLDPLFTNVPDGKGASAINGTFQSRIGGSADKTINFSGNLTPTAVALVDLGARAAGWPGIWLAGLALLFGTPAALYYGRYRRSP